MGAQYEHIHVDMNFKRAVMSCFFNFHCKLFFFFLHLSDGISVCKAIQKQVQMQYNKQRT